MNLDEFVKDKAGCYSIESGFAMWEVKNSEFLRNLDLPEVHIQIFIIRGKINATIDDSNVTLQSDSIIDILHNKMHVKDASTDISSIIIFATEEFTTNLIKNRPPFPIEYVTLIMQQPAFPITHEQSVVIRERFDLALALFKNGKHIYQVEMLKCALWMIYLEIANAFMSNGDEANISSETDRKRMLFMKFVKMLPLHVKQERNIAFYASEMCISCQYLERIVKQISYQTAYQWVQRVLIGEINYQLKDTDKSIRQIADDFNFPDQATFAKYYKRNAKITPSEYRERSVF